MKIPAKNPEITYDVDGNMRITFTTPYKLEDIAGELDELRDKDIDLTIDARQSETSEAITTQYAQKTKMRQTGFARTGAETG